jgi:pyruvate dehydrogenase E2 component (dihydrolipoamide acetyltransferase)
MSTATAASDVLVPDIGDFTDVPIIEILVSPGDTVAQEDPLVTLESDKATMDVPSPMEGVVQEVKVSVGDTVSEGTLLLTLANPDEAQEEQRKEMLAEPAEQEPAQAETTGSADGAAPPAAPEAAGAAGAPAEPGPADEPAAPPYASPGTRRLARELGVDLAQVKGSGRKGRITGDDVRAFKEGGAPAPEAAPAAASSGDGGLDLLPWPSVDFSKYGEVEAVPLSRIKKISGANLARNWVRIPHVTHNDEADITDLEAFRKSMNEEYKKQEVRVTMLAFLIKACVAALKEFPEFNASLDGDNLIVKRYYNIGFAADTPNGLVVPVIKGADGKGIIEIANEMGELSGQARAGKLKPGDMAGGNFSISSLGGIGGTSFTPIVNAPEVAILGVVRSAMKPVWDGAEFRPRLMLPLSLSYDHRVIDGASAARFVKYLVTTLEDMRRVLL